jgi:TolB protein
MKRIVVLAIAAVMIAVAAGVATAEQCLVSTIVFSSNRDNPAGNPLLTGEIYLMDPDGTNPRRLTDDDFGDLFAKVSPDGKHIVFDSNRARVAGEPLNTSDLFLMKADGTDVTLLTRGSSATWSPDGKFIAFHASASGTGLPIRPDPGAPYPDSDIFVARVGDLLESGPMMRTNITNTPDQVEEDPDWSPDGQKIVFTRHPATEHPTQPPFLYPSQALFVLNLGTGVVEQLTHGFEVRAPAWSPDGTRILFMCRIGDPVALTLVPTFEFCTMNEDGTNLTRLTRNTLLDATPTWSPDGQKIAFHRNLSGQLQLFVMNADGTDQTQLTFPPGSNAFAAWGVVRDKCPHDN